MTAIPGTTSQAPLSVVGPASHAPRALSLRANFSWTLAGNAIYALSQLGVLVVLAKLLSATAVGTYALASAVTSPVFFFFSLKLRGAQATDVRGDHPFRDYLGLRLVTTALAVTVAAAMAAFGGHATHTAVAILVVALAKSAEAVSDVLHGLFQLHERMDLGAKAMVVKGPLSLAAMAAAVFLTRSLAWGLVAMACALVAVLLAYELPLARRVNRRAAQAAAGARSATGGAGAGAAGRPLARGMWSLALLTFPLGVTLALVALWQNMPRYFLAHSFGEREVGIFTAVVSPLMAGGLIVTALAQSAGPRLARYHAEGRARDFDKLLLKLMGMGA